MHFAKIPAILTIAADQAAFVIACLMARDTRITFLKKERFSDNAFIFYVIFLLFHETPTTVSYKMF